MDFQRPFQEYRKSLSSPELPEEKLILFVEPQSGEDSSTFRFRWFVTPYWPFHALHLQADTSGLVSDDWVGVDPFQIVASWSSDHAMHVPRSINHEPESIQASNYARNWLEKSLKEHPGPFESFAGLECTPSRLLRIDTAVDGSPEKLCLVDFEPESEIVPYIALSYCWGGPQKVQLQSASASSLRAGLPVNVLSSASSSR